MNILHYSPGEPIPGFDPAVLVSQKADEHLCESGERSRCSLWWNVVPPMDGEKPGVIGHFAADSIESGAELLARAAVRLKDHGCTVAIGPMDGNTWRRYRVLTERGKEPEFFMEPDNPEFWPAVFELAGYSPLASYSSSLVSDLSRRDPRSPRAMERLRSEGVQIRHLDATNFAADLRRIYKVSVVSFTGNFLYTPISEEDFLAQYLPYQEKIRPELVFLAEHEGQPVGYLFALPDYAEALRGQPIRTVIGKTLAVLPGRKFGGLGVVLTDMLHERAFTLGYSRLIHALQHEANSVRNTTGYFGAVMRRYTLYSRRLG